MSQLPLFQASQPPSVPQGPVTVSFLTGYIRDLMETDELLQDVWVQGEVSNLSQPKSGHLYFTVKDAGASLRCVMWRSAVSRQVYLPKDGEAVEVHGNVSVYEASGQYQLYADLLRPVGEGVLFQEFLRLKTKLEAEGLFDLERKRAIPTWPARIGIVTSPSGAALRDMLDTLRRRYPVVEVVLAGVTVQGEAAPREIAAALKRLNQVAQPDVILLGRGGGSIEDLWAFNDEGVARAVAASEAPVISGVGHETDFTIADFAADLRAPTPTAAAELATPDQVELRAVLRERSLALGREMTTILAEQRWRLNALVKRQQMRSPASRVQRDRQRMDDLARRAELALGHKAALQRTRLESFRQQLAALSPMGVMGRGYAVVSRQDGKLVRSVKDVKAGDGLDIQVNDGRFGAEVSKK